MDDLCSMGSNPMVGSDYSTAGGFRQTKRAAGENSHGWNGLASMFIAGRQGKWYNSAKPVGIRARVVCRLEAHRMKDNEVLHAISAMMPEERCCWPDDAMRAGGDCVRQGTRVWRVEGPPVVPPHAGGQGPPVVPPHAEGQDAGGSQGAWNGGEWLPSPDPRGQGPPVVPPHAGGQGAGGSQGAWNEEEWFPSPHAGRGREGLSLVRIEDIHPGDHVLAHDGRVHRVVCTFRHLYRGAMVGLKQAYSSRSLWLTADHHVLAVPTPRSLGGHSDWSGIPKPLRGRSRQLRREMTFPERKLWHFLRGNRIGVAFRRQHPIGRYIADFYSRGARLVVEVDGAATHDGEESEAHDAARDAYLESLGLRVVHIPAREVLRNIEGVLFWLQEVCKEQFRTYFKKAKNMVNCSA